MHLITLRIISNFSVLVIAATLSIVGAVECQPGGLESAPERPATVRLADRTLIRRSESAGKMGKEKGRDTTDQADVHQLSSSYPGLAVVYFGPQSGSVGTDEISGGSESGLRPFTGLRYCGGHLVVVQQEEPPAIGTLDRNLSVCVLGNYSGLFRTAGKLNDSLNLFQ